MASSIVRERKWTATHPSSIDVGGLKTSCTSVLTGLWIANINELDKMEVTEYWRDSPTAGLAIDEGAAMSKGMAKKGMAAKNPATMAKKPATKKPATMAKGMLATTGMAKHMATKGKAKGHRR